MDRVAVRFWNQDAAHMDQKFYTGFCMLTSAFSNWAVGVDLHQQRKLDWAATDMYYSLIHSGRFTCFLSIGDFPTGHSELRQLFADGETVRGSWLKTYKKKHFVDLGNEQTENRFVLSEVRQSLVSMGMLVQTVEEMFKIFSIILPRACDLRNDSNYEGLLIAHQYRHLIVTEEFKRLVELLNKASCHLLPMVVNMFKQYVESSSRKDLWYAFLNWMANREGLYYLEDSLQDKVRDKRAIWQALRWLEPLRQRHDLQIDLARQVHENIVMSTFGAKSKLMNDFRDKIDDLDRQIGKFGNHDYLPLDDIR